MTDYKPWVHRKTAPIRAKGYHHLQIPTMYYRTEKSGFGWVTEICLGERYAHIAPGLIFHNERYRGSYINNWHGGPTGSLTDMIRWIADAKHPEYEYHLWMKLPEDAQVWYTKWHELQDTLKEQDEENNTVLCD